MTNIDSNYLVSTEWLEQHLGDPDLRIFDCTGALDPDFVNHGREKHYNRHHIPGAAYIDVASPKGELTDPDSPLPFTWPTAEQFEATMRRLGVDEKCRVVIYAGPHPDAPAATNVGVTWATRVWWLMHHAGIRCAVLDGGWQKWVREGRPSTSVPHHYAPTNFHVQPDWRRGLALKEDVLEAVQQGTACIVDSLSPQSYRGEVDKQYGSFGTRRGHITGAVNVYFESLTDPATGCFLPLDRLRERFAQGGVPEDGPVITYCGGGIGATMTGLALKMLGHDDVAIYDGSMWEWNADPSLPMTDPSQTR